jgi:hypothetical protein
MRQRNSAARDERRSESDSQSLRALLDAGRASPAISLEELDRRLGPLTDVEKARAEVHLRILELLEADQGAEVTEEQDRAIELVVAAAAYCRGEVPLAQLAAGSDFTEDVIRAAAVAMKAVQTG